MDKEDILIEARLPGDDNWSNMLFLASAYAEAAEVLCSALQEDDYAQQYTSTMVIRQLCRHAIELFLKGAIGMKSGHVLATHRLDRLYPEYTRLYPNDVFHFTMPIPKELLSSEDFFADELESYQRDDAEKYRYPASRQGQSFASMSAFDVGEEMKVIENLRSAINHLGFQLAERFQKIYRPGGLF
ncbi:MAG: hypothetical protein V4864_16055 [Pseudomonadota bacterium]